MNDKLFFRQLFDAESFTYTYLLADTESREAVLIDTVLENVERDLKLVEQLGFKLKYALDTHVHADHVTGAGKIRELTGAKTVVGAGAKVDCASVNIADGETVSFGPFSLRALSTPGHTDGCTSYYVEGMVFTGDALLIRGNGRTDFQQGSSEKLFIASWRSSTNFLRAQKYTPRMITAVRRLVVSEKRCSSMRGFRLVRRYRSL
ncbi:MAG: MBL fold metallo-hydrolase [Bdellovibrionota bacterium]